MADPSVQAVSGGPRPRGGPTGGRPRRIGSRSQQVGAGRAQEGMEGEGREGAGEQGSIRPKWSRSGLADAVPAWAEPQLVLNGLLGGRAVRAGPGDVAPMRGPGGRSGVRGRRAAAARAARARHRSRSQASDAAAPWAAGYQVPPACPGTGAASQRKGVPPSCRTCIERRSARARGWRGGAAQTSSASSEAAHPWRTAVAKARSGAKA